MDSNCVKVNKVVKVKDYKKTTLVTLLPKEKKNITISADDQVIHEHKRLSDSLQAPASIDVITSRGVSAAAKRMLNAAGAAACSLLHSAKYFVMGNIKKAAFSATCGGVVAAVTVSILATTCTFAYEVRVDGEVIGVVPTVEAYDELVHEVDSEVKAITGSGIALSQEVNFGLKLIPKGTCTDPAEMNQNIKAVCDGMVEACAVKVDGKVLFAMSSHTTAQALLEQYKQQFVGDGLQQLDFACPVELNDEHVPRSILKTAQSGLSALQAEVETEQTTTIQAGESFAAAAQRLGVSEEQLLSWNDGIDTNALEAGQTLKYVVKSPILPIRTKQWAAYEEAVPYDTQTIELNDQYVTMSEVVTPGEDGLRFVEAYIVKINGQETGREILTQELRKAPVTEVIKAGTKPLPSPIGTGSFSNPYGGTLTSRFGSRWGRQHAGIDIAGNIGDPVYAADNGRVVYAQYNDGGYGNLVQIDHGNGYVTYYGHNSELCVKVGDVVGKGDVVAKLGNTGRSTGPHLHFEVRKNGEPVDPTPYIQ